MSIVTQINLFSEENLRELEKISTNYISITSRKVIKKLDEERANGRNDYPVVCMWRLLLAKRLKVYYANVVEITN